MKKIWDFITSLLTPVKWLWKKKKTLFWLSVLGLLCYVGVISVQKTWQFVLSLGDATIKVVEKQATKTSVAPSDSIAPAYIRESSVYTTPVRNYTFGAKWVYTTAMFRDSNGFFITPPGVSVNGRIPFEEFAQKHPDQAQIILNR